MSPRLDSNSLTRWMERRLPSGMLDRLRQLGRWCSRHRVLIEALIAIFLLINQISGARVIFAGVLMAVVRAIQSGVALSISDPPTRTVFALTLAKLGVAWAPTLYFASRLRWQRRIWLLLLLVPAVFISGCGLASCLDLPHWIALAAMSALAFYLVRFRFLGVMALLPLALLLEPALNHPFGRQVWTSARLAPRCALNDGERPLNIDPRYYAAVYHGITPIDDRHFLLTGDGKLDSRLFDLTDADGGAYDGSYWVTRQANGYVLGGSSGAHGNLWNGCVLDSTAWYMSYRNLIGVYWLGEGRTPADRVENIDVWTDNGDFDKPGPACDPARDLLYYTDATAGGFFQYNMRTRQKRSFDIGGLVPNPLVRRDGRVVMTDSARLEVFDPQTWTVLERQPAGSALVGFDLCARDGTAVVSDLTGRLRIFEENAQGGYRFSWGLTLRAPREVHYSPDCQYIGLTSADDTSLFLIDTEKRAVVRTFHLGPSLRDFAFLAPREIAAADACTVTRLTF